MSEALLIQILPLAAQYGFQLVGDLVDIINKSTVTGDDFRALATKYGTKTADDYLKEEQAQKTASGLAIIASGP